MSLTPGMRLRSQVCATEVIVVRAAQIPLTCGGQPMIPHGDTPPDGISLDPGLSGGNSLGKRYTDVGGTLEILITKQGAGTLADGATPLVIKDAKPLPSSD